MKLATLLTVLCLADAALAQSYDDPPPVLPAAPPVPPANPGHDPSVQISEYVRCIFQDRDGHMWFGTNSEGVCRYDGTSLVFFGPTEGFAGFAARDIVQTADGAIWFSTERGVSRYRDGRFTNYTEADGLSSDDTWRLMLDRAGTLWVATREGVCRWVTAADADAPAKRGQKPFVPFAIPRAPIDPPEHKFDPRLVWGMFEERDGSIWFVHDGEGARRFDGKSFTTYTKAGGLVGNQTRCVFGDSRGRIWIGADNAGVSCFDGKAFRNYTEADGLANNRVFTVFEDRAGDLWFATLGAGVTRYDGKTFTPYRQLGNLPRAHVQSIFQDKDGAMWFGCSGGLFRLDGDKFVNVTKAGPWK